MRRLRMRNSARLLLVLGLVLSLVTGLGLMAFGQSGAMAEDEQARWLGFFFFYLIFWAVLLHKAGRAWWLAFVPIINVFVFFDILGWHWTGSILLLVPFVNMIAYFAICLFIAKSYGKSEIYGFTLAFFWPIMIPFLALGRAIYHSPWMRDPESISLAYKA